MPTFMQRFLSPLAAAAGFEVRQDSERLWSTGPVTMAASGQWVTNETASQLDVVQSVLGRLAGSISTLPMMVFERLDGDERRPAKDHPLARLLRSRPNRRQSSQEYRDEQQLHLGWWRNCYARIIPGDDPIGELEPIHPSRVVNVARGPNGRIYYTIRRLAPDVGFDVYSEDDIHHIRKAPLTDDGLRGKPVWETARETLGRALAVEMFGALYFANGGSGGGVLKHPGNFKSKEDEAAFLETWRAGGSGANRHRERLLKFGVEYQPLNIPNDEAQFLETLKETSVKVSRLWNMPPHLVGILDRATFSNIEQQSIEYVVHTLAPWISAWEQGVGRDLLIGKDQDRYFVEINVAGLLRGDLKARFEAYMQGRQGGWLSINDIRRIENMNPIENGDDYLQPLNMAPAGSKPSEAPADA